MKASILYLTQYYPPEGGAASLRAFENAKELSKIGHKVTLISPFPNYPKGKIESKNKFKLYHKTTSKNLTHYQIPILALGRSKSIHHYLLYFSFVFTSFLAGLILKKKEIVYCSSPPLFLGISALIISKLKRSKLCLEVRDLWPESVVVVKNIDPNHLFIRLAYRLEKLLYDHSFYIIALTKGFIEHIHKLSPKANVLYAPNGIDTSIPTQKKDSSLFLNLGLDAKKTTLGYYGVLGKAQSLSFILDVAKKKSDHLQILIVGFGQDFELINQRIKNEKITNVILHPAVSQSDVAKYVALCDLYLVSLIPSPLFKVTIPSKIFAGMYHQKVVLAGVSGEAKSIIDESGGGECFLPQDINDCCEMIEHILKSDKAYQESGYRFVKENFDRQKISMNISCFISKAH